MPLAALLLVLGAAVCHSTWNLLVKTEPRRLEIQSGALIVGTLLCAPVLFVYSLGEVPAVAWPVILVSGVLETSYVFALSAAYGAGDLSLVYPVARGVLRELGVEVPEDVEVRVWDSTSEVRYLVLPERPRGTEGWSEAELAGIVTRDSMIGVAKVQAPARGGRR